MLNNLLLVSVILVTLFAYTNPIRFLLYVGLLVNLPTIVTLNLLKIAFQRVSSYNGRMLEENRYTVWFKVTLKLRLRIIKLDDELSESIVWFLGERGKGMIKISKGKATVEYTPVSEREEGVANPATVVMKRLTRARLAELRDGLLALNKKGAVTKIRANSVRLQITRESIVSLNNFSINGTPVVFDPANRNELYELLPAEIAAELEERFGDGELDFEAVEERIAKQEAEAEAEGDEDAEDDESEAA